MDEYHLSDVSMSFGMNANSLYCENVTALLHCFNEGTLEMLGDMFTTEEVVIEMSLFIVYYDAESARENFVDYLI